MTKARLVSSAPLIASLAAVGTVAVDAWLGRLEDDRYRTAQVTQQAQLDQAWEMLRDAVAALADDAKLLDQELDDLRVAVAELRGAIGALRHHRVERALRGSTVDRLADEEDVPVEHEFEALKKRTMKLPGALPKPEPAQMIRAAKTLNLEGDLSF